MREKAKDYYINKGYSCSESIVKTAIDEGMCPKDLMPCATTFCGGMLTGCLCGVIAGAQIVLGYNFGRENVKGNENIAREKAKEFVEEFKKRNKYTCCRILSKNVSLENKKEHCSKLVESGAEILESMLKVRV